MNDFEKEVRRIIETTRQEAQYGVSRVPYHTHNNIDSPLISSLNLPASASGSTTEIQYNNSGSLAGSANFTWVEPGLYVGASTGGGIDIDGSIQVHNTNASGTSEYAFLAEGYLAVRQFTVNTTDATPASAGHISSGPFIVEAFAFAVRTGGSAGTANDSAGYIRRAMYKSNGSTPSLVGAVQDDFTAESQAGWDFTFTISGNNVQFVVTGAANNNISWYITVKAYSTGVF